MNRHIRYSIGLLALAMPLGGACGSGDDRGAGSSDGGQSDSSTGGSSGSAGSSSGSTGGSSGSSSGSSSGTSSGSADSGSSGGDGGPSDGSSSESGGDASGNADAACTVKDAGGPLAVTNFDSAGKQVQRLDTNGKQIDAHEGQLSYWGCQYYLYGDSYGCGFAWQVKGTPFCGFKVYTSPDLVTWTDGGFLFDATTANWQMRCDGNTQGCFRPKVVHNASTGKYVLWFNSHDNTTFFHVFESNNPGGPFAEIGAPKLAVNGNHGDDNLFVDQDGKGYFLYTDWSTGGDIVIELLDSTYHNGTGKYVKLGQSATEAPSMFRRNNTYYLTYSDPNCGYCSGTGTSYKTASAPLGPWSAKIKISPNSCGGQPNNVSILPGRMGPVYAYQSDLWLGTLNETKANQFWAPLAFDSTGQIQNITCAPTAVLN